VTLLFIVLESSFVLSTISVSEEPFAMHLVVFKLACVLTSVRPGVDPVAFHFVFNEISIVTRLIKHDKFSFSVSIPMNIFAFECSVVPCLFTETMLFVMQPLTLVDSVISSHKLALPVLHIVFPIAYIEATIRIDHATETILLVDSPVAVISLTVRPNLLAATMALLATPRSVINSAISHNYILTFPRLLIKVNEHFFTNLVFVDKGWQIIENGLNFTGKIITLAHQIIFSSDNSREMKPKFWVFRKN